MQAADTDGTTYSYLAGTRGSQKGCRGTPADIVDENAAELILGEGAGGACARTSWLADQSRERRRQLGPSALRTVLVLAASVFLAEGLVMILLAWLPSFGPWWSALLDSVTLVLLVSPGLYYFAFRPLVSMLQQQERVEEMLRRINDSLESRVKERTTSLQRANQKLEAQVAERKRAEHELRESREDLKRAQAVTHIGSWRLDWQHDEALWSDETYRIFGLPLNAPVTCQSFLDAVHPEDRAVVERQWQAALGGEAYDLEHRIVVGDAVKWVRGRGTLEVGPQGQLLSGFGTVQDITEWKRVESALAQARANLEQKVQERTAELCAINERLCQEIAVRQRKERDLAEAEQRYRTVADFTFDWEYWRAPEGALLYCSPSCERITGYSAQELVAEPELLEQIVHKENQEAWERHAAAGAADAGFRTILFRIRRKDGQQRWIEHSCRPVIGSQGEFLGVRASNRDVTERKQAEMEMQQLRDELARATRISTAGQLSAALAHELNQPLGAIVCNVQAIKHLLSQETPDLPEVREALQDIETDSKRAGEVIRQLRSLFQKTDPTRSAVQFNDILETTSHFLHSELLLRGVTLRLQLEPQLPPVLGSEVELQQVVLNLFTNAIEAMVHCPSGCRCLEVATARQDASTIHISVRDSGTGLAADKLHRVFEPFYTTKTSGMGMGLAICRSIVEAHSGRLWVENNAHRGATFHLTLPILTTQPS